MLGSYMQRIMKWRSFRKSMYPLFICCVCAAALADGAADKNEQGSTVSEVIGGRVNLVVELISSGAMERPPIRSGKIFYDGQDKRSIPIGSMNELLQLYSDEELDDVIEVTWASCKFRSIEGLSRLRNLKTLDLVGNRIATISGIEACPLLEVVNLSQNWIERIEGLTSLPQLRELYLANNRIKRIEGLEDLKNLEVLILEGNQITKIEGLGHLPALKRLGLAGNRLRDVSGLLELGDLNEISIRSLDNQLDERAMEIIAEWNRRHSDNPFAQL